MTRRLPHFTWWIGRHLIVAQRVKRAAFPLGSGLFQGRRAADVPDHLVRRLVL